MNLKKLRLDKKLSQEQLARILNTNRTSISKIESSNKIPTIELLMSYAKEFEITTDALLGLTTKYDGYINQQAYYKGKSYQDMVNFIIDNYIEIIKQDERNIEKFNSKQYIEFDSYDEINKNIKGLDIKQSMIEYIKKIGVQIGVNFDNYDENIILNFLHEILFERNVENIKNLYLFLNNLEKFKDITKEIVDQNSKKISLVTEILKEFNTK